MSTHTVGAERRDSERRQADRRRTQRRAPARPEGPGAGPGYTASPDLRRSAHGPDESLPESGASLEDSPSRRRILAVYGGARVLVAAALAAAQGLGSGWGLSMSSVAGLVVGLYAVQVVAIWVVPRTRGALMHARRDPEIQWRWLLTVGADLLVLLALHVLQPDGGTGYTALLVLPVMMAGVFSPRLMALGTAAAVSLVLLAVGGRAALASPDGLAVLAQQGFTGIGFFVIALLASELSSRLLREEQAAAGSLELARRQALLNRLVLEEMAEGVLVVDRRLRVRAVNPAGQALISGGGVRAQPPFALTQQASWGVLADAVEAAFRGEHWPEAGRVLELLFPEVGRRALIVRMRFARSLPGQAAGRSDSEDHCVLFVEDARTVQARARQDKLAAMGRMSAGIAHEIRNPLAAISQANQLLAEDLQAPQQRELARMVADNVGRLQRIVEDVLASVALPPGSGEARVEARAEVADIVADWASASGLAPDTGGVVRLDLPPDELPVGFDADHLRRVLLNLLDNARRHSTGASGSIHLRLAVRDEATAVIALASDGEPIGPAVEQHLFEPFFSTRSRGSGLGLYICRELCERNGASVEFRLKAPQERHRNAFVIVMRRAGTSPSAEVT